MINSKTVLKFAALICMMGLLPVQPASAQNKSGADEDVLAMTPADQVRAFRAFWGKFADTYYEVQLLGEPKVIAQNGANQKVCFSFKVKPGVEEVEPFMTMLSDMTIGDRPVHLGTQALEGVAFTKLLSDTWGQYREIDLGRGRGKKKIMGFFDFTSQILKRSPKIVLYLPGLREVVIRTNGKVNLRLPFLVSLDSKGKDLTDKEIIHVPTELCSDWIPETTIKKESTAMVETIALSPLLDRIPLNL